MIDMGGKGYESISCWIRYLQSSKKDLKFAGPKHNFAKIYIGQRRKACQADPNFVGQGPRSSTYFGDCI